MAFSREINQTHVPFAWSTKQPRVSVHITSASGT